MNNILVIAAHPDDEILGCGGTLAKHVFNGDIVNTVIFGEGVTSREKVTNQHEKLNKIKIEAEEANKIIRRPTRGNCNRTIRTSAFWFC